MRSGWSFPLVRACLLAVALGAPGLAQSYQTQFGSISFDRSKGPGTFLKGVEVDGGSGSLAINLPLGPGIGARGLRFQPVLNGRWSPQVEVYPMYIGPSNSDGVPTGAGDPSNWRELPRAAAAGGFDLTPGFLQLVFDEDGEASFTENRLETRAPTQQLTHFQGPEGWTASLNMSEPLAGDVPAPAEALQLIRTFGFEDAGWSIARMTDQACAPSSASFIRRGPAGELVLGLEHPTLAPRQFGVPVVGTAISPGGSTPDTYFWFPSDFLVIRGDLAYEFRWRSNRYGTLDRTVFFKDIYSQVNGNLQGLETWIGHRFLKHAAFALASIHNRFGDRIDIAADDAGHWTAAWSTSEGSTGASITWDGSTLAYHGEGPQPSFLLQEISSNKPATANSEGITVGPAPAQRPFDGFRSSKIGKVTFQSTGEEVQFGFTQEVVATDAFGSPVDLLEYPGWVLFPGRKVGIRWNDRTEFLRNKPQSLSLASDHYLAMGDSRAAGYNWLPVYRRGVDQIIESDEVSGGLGDGPSSSTRRITTHARKVPQPARSLGTLWLSTAFYDLVTHPDGRSTLTRYVEPLAGELGGSQSSVAARMQTLAFLKHQAAEIRHYAAGVDPTADILVTAPAPNQPYLVPLGSTLAYRVEIFDRWDLRGTSNPDGRFDLSAVPYPTRTRVWDKLDQTLETKESTHWDPATRGWRSNHTLRERADTAPNLEALILSRAMMGEDVTLLPSSPDHGTYRVETRTFQSDAAQWIFGRMASDRVDVQADCGEGWGGFQALPASLPTRLMTYDPTHPELNRIASVQVGTGSETVTTQFTYKGVTGIRSGQVERVELHGTGEDRTEPVGAAYQYDATYGFLNRISPFGVAWHLEQASDSLGRAISQRDANGFLTLIGWDEAGRLSTIQPESPETGTSITPDGDNRGYTVTRGASQTQYRYNPFGELVLERRFNGTDWSHRIFGYDPAGRKVAETVWNRGWGDETEWKAPNLVRKASVLVSYSPGHYESSCAMEDPDTGKCLKFVKIWVPAETRYTTAEALHPGTSYAYDDYGRLSRTVDPNGVISESVYGVRQKVVTAAPGSPDAASTTYLTDADGRVYRVVDALGQASDYRFDLGGRLASVVQWSGAAGVGPSQSRTWTYSPLGRLTELAQPESGRTSYSGFTLAGAPTRTTYGTGSLYPKTLTTAYDALGRVRSVVSEDGTIQRGIQYDESGHGAGNDRMTSAQEGPTRRSLVWSGLNGRLSSLTRAVDGRDFTLGLDWNTDGTLHTRTYPDGRIQVLQYEAAKGLPNGSTFTGGGTTTLAYDPDHWGLRSLTFGNAATTFMGYDPDQVRLKYLKHLLGDGSTLRDWSYQYDARGRLGTDGEDFYGYDALGRLTSVVARDVDPATGHVANSPYALAQAFDYDPFGNRKSLSTRAVANWAWGTAPPLPLATTAVAGQRDLRSFAMAAGEVVSMAATNHLPASLGGVLTGAVYDDQGNLTQIQREPGSTSSALNTQLQMGYDALGRVRTLIDRQHGTTEVYTYDDEGLRALVEVYQGLGTVAPQDLVRKVYRIYNESRQLVAEYDLVLE